jgi:type II secretory pathway pseudopilin PulG
MSVKHHINKKGGFTIVEIIIAIVIVVSVFGTILSFFSLDIRTSERNRTRLQALLFAQEAMEAVRSFRDNTTWSGNGPGILISGTNYHPVIASSGWSIISGSENTGIFTRNIVFYNVSRNINDNIESVYNPANKDPDTKKVIVVVSWNDRYGPASESLTSYITNWRN